MAEALRLNPAIVDISEETYRKIGVEDVVEPRSAESWRRKKWEEPEGLCAALTDDGSRAVAGYGRSLRFWNLETKEALTRKAHLDHVLGVAFLPDGERLLSASRDQTLKLWSFDRTECLATVHFDFDLTCLALSADGTTLMVGDQVGLAHFLRVQV